MYYLADIFENFRDSYGLDLAYYYTFTWDAILKHTRIEFEFLTDVVINIILFIEHGIRGGLNQCSNRYAQANSKYMQSSKSSTYLMYYDHCHMPIFDGSTT